MVAGLTKLEWADWVGRSIFFSVIQYLSFLYLFLRMSPLNVIYVHMNSKGDVFEVVEEVSDSDSSEDHVDRVPHVPVGEHQDVGKVEQGAQHAHQHRQPAVDWIVEVLKMYNSPKFDDFLDEVVTFTAEKLHIVIFEGVVPMPAITVLPSTSTITACVVVEKFPEM